MTEGVVPYKAAVSAELLEAVLIGGDLAKLTPEQRVSYYRAVCNSVGLNALTKPFDYLTLNGKLVLYANRNCAEQLRENRKVSVTIPAREVLNEGMIYVVSARATLPDGRSDESTGVVNIKGLAGDVLANIMMKCETKAKRRVTLSICGLGMLDETETVTIPGARPVNVDVATGEISDATADECAGEPPLALSEQPKPPTPKGAQTQPKNGEARKLFNERAKALMVAGQLDSEAIKAALDQAGGDYSKALDALNAKAA